MAVVVPADRHQPLADVGAGGDRHPQSQRGILVHIAPVGAKQESPLRFAERGEVAQYPVAHAVGYRSPAWSHLRRQELQQRGLARSGFADDRQHLAGIERKRHIAARGQPAVILAQAVRHQQRSIVVHFSHARPPCAELRFRCRDGPGPGGPRNNRCRNRRTYGCPGRR